MCESVTASSDISDLSKTETESSTYNDKISELVKKVSFNSRKSFSLLIIII